MIETVVYECKEPLTEEDRFMAFLVQDTIVLKGPLKGATGKVFLPVRFMSDSEDGAREKAIAFWNDETYKKQAKKERGRQLGLSRRKDRETA